MRTEPRKIARFDAALTAALLVAGACAGPVGSASGELIERTVYLMGTEAQIRVAADTRGQALAASEAALRALEAAERRLTTWDSAGELAQVNAGAHPSPVLQAELAEAVAWSSRTEGAFNPRCAALVAVWGLRSEPSTPTPTAVQLATSGPSGWDEGGFGKGAALRDAARVLSQTDGVQRAQIDLGGQWLLLGDGEFEIEVAHPDARHQSVGRLRLPAGSVATSGNSERGIEIDGKRVGHVLDPRTGYPAQDFGSITVVHADPFAADCLSTALLVLGPERALAWANEDPDFGVVIAERQPDGLVVRVSRDLKSHFHPIP